MDGNIRRKKIINILSDSDKPLSGSSIAKTLGVSRQVIVQDIALLRADNNEIFSTHRGYVLANKKQECTRVLKVCHSDDDSYDEMFTIVDFGATIKDVFIYHKAYGTIKADMDIKSRQDAIQFMEKIASGKSSLLKNATSGYHYHTIAAASEHILDLIQDELKQKGYLAQLQDYEPINFWQ